jgi:hypothetical protein
MLLFAEELKADAFKFKADLLELGPAQGKHGVGKIFENADLVIHFVHGRDVPSLDHGSVGSGEGQKEFLAVDPAFRDRFRIFRKGVGFIENDVIGEPLPVTAVAPLGQILRLRPLCGQRSATY